MNEDYQIDQQMVQVAQGLRRVADSLEKTSKFQVKQVPEKEMMSEFGDNLFEETSLILQLAIDQLAGNKPEDLDPDQLYGWSDSLQRTLGNKASAPNSEIRKLEDLVVELREVLGRK